MSLSHTRRKRKRMSKEDEIREMKRRAARFDEICKRIHEKYEDEEE